MTFCESIKLLSDCSEIINEFETWLDNPENDVSIQKIKAIEDAYKKYPAYELKEMKLKMLAKMDEKRSLFDLRDSLANGLQEKLAARIFKMPKPNMSMLSSSIANTTNKKSLPNYEKPLGSKGNSNLEDYIIPVISLMRKGKDYKEAFHEVADQLDVRYNTVSSQCTRGLKLTTDEFVNQATSGRIIQTLEMLYPEKTRLIQQEIASKYKTKF